MVFAVLLSFVSVQAQMETDASPPQAEAEARPTISENNSPNQLDQSAEDSKKSEDSSSSAPSEQTRRDARLENIQEKREERGKAKSSLEAPSDVNSKSNSQSQKNKSASKPKPLKKVREKKSRKRASPESKKRALKNKIKNRPKREENFSSSPERGRFISAPSGKGLIGYVPNFEKEFLPGYHELIDTWKTSLPHQDAKEGFFSIAGNEDSEEQAGKGGVKETLQKKWEENSPSKRTLINLSILVVLALGLLFYRIRGGHFSR